MHAATADDSMDLLSTTVIDAIAKEVGTDPIALQPPLYDVIDLEALDQLARSGDSLRVTFAYGKHLVTVFGDGTVSVEDDGYGGR